VAAYAAGLDSAALVDKWTSLNAHRRLLAAAWEQVKVVRHNSDNIFAADKASATGY
jgi:hypothetical protein